jgi:hypothetical protein
LDLLTGGDRVHPRQQTMRALIDWSHELLSAREQIVFRRLSVFAGGFTFDGATAVCAGQGVEREEMFETLTSLIRKSMLADDLASIESRYRLLDSMREYGFERLTAAGETHGLAHAHARYFLGAAQRHYRLYQTAATQRWIDDLMPDIDNVRAALDWSLEHRNDVPLGAALTAATMQFFNETIPGESARRIARAVELLPRDTEPAIEAALNVGITTGTRNRDAATLRAAGERAVELYRRIGDDEGLVRALRGLAQNIGWFFREDREEADRLACESIAIARKLGNPIQLAGALRTRGLTIDISDFPAKRTVLLEALALMRAHGNEREVGTMLTWLSDLEFSAGDVERAIVYGREAARIADASGSTQLRIVTLGNLSQYAAAVGDWETVATTAERGLRLSMDTREHEHITYAVQALAIRAAGMGNHRKAAQLIGFCDARAGALHPPRQADQSEDILHRRLLAELRAALDEVELAREMQNGAAFTEGDAAATALTP